MRFGREAYKNNGVNEHPWVTSCMSTFAEGPNSTFLGLFLVFPLRRAKILAVPLYAICSCVNALSVNMLSKQIRMILPRPPLPCRSVDSDLQIAVKECSFSSSLLFSSCLN